jgi:hypothetical protein
MKWWIGIDQRACEKNARTLLRIRFGKVSHAGLGDDCIASTAHRSDPGCNKQRQYFVACDVRAVGKMHEIYVHLQALVGGVDAGAPGTYLAAVALTVGLTQLAGLIPARRAAATNVLQALTGH